MNLARRLGRQIFKYIPGEYYAFRIYEETLNRIVARSINPSGWFEVKYPVDGISPIKIYEPVSGPSGRAKLRGEYEQAVANELVDLGADSHVWLIGGGFGFHAMGVGQVADSVTVFEADSERAEKIREAIKKNELENIKVIKGIVGSEIFLSEFNPPDVALMDIEGWETKALRTASSTVNKIPNWIIEVHEEGVAGIENGVDSAELQEYLSSSGFKITKLSHRKPGNYHIKATHETR